MKFDRILARALAFLVALSPATPVWADPCGMVPPIWLGDGATIARTGLQKTYVFHRDGIESIVIRPGFTGNVDEFGMLIPFPSPPALRKIADDVFGHVAAAVDPPEVVVDLRERFFCDLEALGYAGSPSPAREARLSVLRKDEVRVVREEAMGMYEVAVLEAGSAQALSRWMSDHGYRYPEGMDATCDDYVAQRWCFVAVKARVGRKAGADPRPGMREVDTSLPPGASFEGHVQAMGFRFRSEELVVPMRLSAFNEGDLRNVVYVLSDGPKKILDLAEGLVVRQVPGDVLLRNVTDPLPLRVIGGDLTDIPEWRLQSLPAGRDPRPKNGIARDLFASDLLAVRRGELALPHEELEKELLEIGERLGLRGPELDTLHAQALEEARERVIRDALADLAEMTLTIVDGDLPREFIAARDLEFVAYGMPSESNRRERYDARFQGPAPALGGLVDPGSSGLPPAGGALLGLGLLLALGALAFRGTRRGVRRAAVGAGCTAMALGAVGLAHANESRPASFLADRVGPAGSAPAASPAPEEPRPLEGEPQEDVEELLAVARSGARLPDRGRALVALAERGGPDAVRGLHELFGIVTSELVRTWCSAALVRIADSPRALARLTDRVRFQPALVRPVTTRWLELLEDPAAPVPLGEVLSALARSPSMQEKLLPALLERGAGPFVEAMLTAGTDEARRLAAASLATLATQATPGRGDVALRVLAAYRFDPEAARVPWSGGALFVPSLAWAGNDARLLFRHLVAWHLWCERGGIEVEARPIETNLRSVALARAAGYSMPAGANGSGAVPWLVALRDSLGVFALERILEEQELSDHPRYSRLLDSRR